MRTSGNVVYAADLFCGAGGTSRGLARACERLGRPVDLVAVNHWPRAVATHELNHPWARHYCARIESLDPRRAVPSGKLDLIVAGVECTHHSRARGGKPMSDQSRSSAWHVLHWAEQLHVREVLIENVPEFVQWGPVDATGRPIPEKRGATFRAFVDALESLNYRVDWRVLTAADFGDPTTRRRFFLRARLGGEEIAWPEPTHSEDGSDGLPLWRPAREIIDWSDLGESIFGRRKPLAERTIARIAEGIRRFCSPEYVEPFLVMLYGSNTVRSVDRPLPTVTARGEHIGLAQPFLTMLYGNSTVRPVELPCPTVTAGPGHIALATPCVLPATRGEVQAGGDLLPFLVPYYGTGVARSVEHPVGTITTHDRFALVTPDGAALDIYFRMLRWPELARAQGFPDDYRFSGTKTEVVRQIGNAVPVHTSENLCLSILAEEEAIAA